MVMEMSKTYQYRKVMKPLLERKRRARINKCLDDLKDLMVECLQQEGEHVTRLEKADILELTVEHMRKLKQRGSLSLQTQSNMQVESFRSGYVHAADQITQVLLQQRQTDEVGQKIIKFLSTRLMELQHQLLRATTTTTTPATLLTPPLHLPTANSDRMDYATPKIEANRFENYNGDSELSSFMNFGSNIDNQQQLIDVTTVEEKCSAASPAFSVIDENSESGSESVWRPW